MKSSAPRSTAQVAAEYVTGLLSLLVSVALLTWALGWRVGFGLAFFWVGQRLFDGATKP